MGGEFVLEYQGWCF